MHSLNATLPHCQRGSFYTMVMMVVLLGTFLTVILKIVPAYTDNSVVNSAMQAVMARSDYRAMSVNDIRGDIGRSMQVNGIDDFAVDQVKLTREGASEFIDINYEKRIHITSNIYAVVVFTNRYPK